MWCDWRAGIRGSHFKGAIFCQLAHLVGRRPKTKEILFNAQKLWRRCWWWSNYGILQPWIGDNGKHGKHDPGPAQDWMVMLWTAGKETFYWMRVWEVNQVSHKGGKTCSWICGVSFGRIWPFTLLRQDFFQLKIKELLKYLRFSLRTPTEEFDVDHWLLVSSAIQVNIFTRQLFVHFRQFLFMFMER